MANRAVSLLLALVMVFSFIPASGRVAYAANAEGPLGNNLYWSFQNGVLTVSGKGEMMNGSISYYEDFFPWHDFREVIEEVYIGDDVTSIGDEAFAHCTELRKVSLGSSIARIGDGAFCACTNLVGVSIPDRVEIIGASSFEGCESLTSIIIPDAVRILDDFAFSHCFSLEDVALGSGISEISEYAFSDSALTEIVIPDQVTTIGNAAFIGCARLTDIKWGKGVTHIGDSAFAWCDSLENLVIPPSVSTIDVAAFADCNSITSVAVGGEGTVIANDAFISCESLIEVTLRAGTISVGEYSFGECITLQKLAIPDSIMDIGYGAFSYCEALTDVYYGGNSEQWNDIAIGSGNTSLTSALIHYNSESEIDKDNQSAATIDDLRPVDYLALSSLAYKSFGQEDLGKTVKEYLADCWDAGWEQTPITYQALFSGVAAWEICYYKENESNGFFAAAFQNVNNEIVIAYRGSESIEKLLESEDARNDWLANDFPMILFNEITEKNQVGSAFFVYEDIAEGFEPEKIVVTGHSLGGGLGDLVAARYGCRAETVNAISVLDVMYFNGPDIFSENFNGVDLWQILDHANQYDRLAGVYEELFASKVKPYAAYKSLYSDSLSNLLKHHSLSSYVDVNSDNTLTLTEKLYEYKPVSAISKWLPSVYPWGQSAIDLGVSGDDSFALGLKHPVSRSSYGGDGNDIIKTSIWEDSLIGGAGNDVLDGGWGDDRYIYYKGHGMDTIYDAAGDDKLHLYGFSDSDSIEVKVSSTDSSFIEVRCNGEVIVRVYRNNRLYSYTTLNRFSVCRDLGDYTYDSHDITSLFSKKAYGKRLFISCPVNVEILDTQGNVVYTLEDGVTGSYYTEYGNFYVFEEENGEYGKVLDLVEGYSARVVGVAEGTMEASCWEVVDGVLSEEKKVSDIPVTENYVARIDTGETGEIQLTAEAEESHTHTWNSGVVTVAPTCEKTGTVLYICTEDPSHTMYVSAPVVDHSYENGKCKFCGLEEPAGIPGDVTGDGKADYSDALLILRASIGLDTLTEDQKQIADVNADGKPDYSDALLILRRSIGLE